MKSQKPTKRTLADFHVQFNSISVSDLFKKYEEIGFMYPAKKALLEPFMKRIQKNWECLQSSEQELLWMLTNEEINEKDFASVSFWKHSNYGLIAQHLVSSGNPFLSLKVMLAAQFKAEHHYGEDEVRSGQNWFRPNNRYAYRIFASMYEKLGPKTASLIPFQYLHLPMDREDISILGAYEIREVMGRDQDLIDFIKANYNEVFVQAEELDQEDIELQKLGKSYEACGLTRSRKVLVLIHKKTGKIQACMIANRAPLGLNFSFLENRCYYILDKSLDRDYRAILVNIMNKAVKKYYAGFALGNVPIVTDKKTSDTLQQQGAVFVREYMQSIWLREGFPLWYEHIASFLKKIEMRFTQRTAISQGGPYARTA